MSPSTRVMLWLAGLWLLALGCVLAAGAWVVGNSQQAVWAERNRSAAAAVAAELGRLPEQGDARRAAAAARFERGDLLHLALRDAQGTPLFAQRRPLAEVPSFVHGDLPGWAVHQVVYQVLRVPEPGRAKLAESGTAGASEVVVLVDGADLRSLAAGILLRGAAIALVTSLALLALAALLAGWLQGRLRATVAQAQALERLQFVEATEPRWPELRDLTRAMNAVVRRLRDQVSAQAEQVAQLQRQAQTDGVTGLPLRAFFVSRLADLLADARLPGASLLLVRVPELRTLNERHGRDEADRLLVAVADVLLTYAERIPGAAAGRLAGQDFALALPAAGAARETAAAIQAAVAASPAARLPGIRVAVAGCDGLRELAAGAALAAADAALARAEASSECVVEDLSELGATGAGAWRDQIAAALDESRVRLGAFPVVDAQGRLIHLECPLRVQVEPGGEFLVARRWLAMAVRGRLISQVDLTAVNLALAAIAADGQPRCVHVAPRSLLGAGFARTLLARLKSAGPAAARLSIEWTDMPEASASAALREAVPAWRQLGVRVGVEHAGASPRALPALKEIGIDYVKVDARHLLGVADDAAARSYVESLVALIHGLGLHALAEGVTDARQLEWLWTLGFDGATGAAVGLAASGELIGGRVEEGIPEP